MKRDTIHARKRDRYRRSPDEKGASIYTALSSHERALYRVARVRAKSQSQKVKNRTAGGCKSAANSRLVALHSSSSLVWFAPYHARAHTHIDIDVYISETTSPHTRTWRKGVERETKNGNSTSKCHKRD